MAIRRENKLGGIGQAAPPAEINAGDKLAMTGSELLTANVTALELDAANELDPAYEAVRRSLPVGKALVLRVAIALFRLSVPNRDDPG